MSEQKQEGRWRNVRQIAKIFGVVEGSLYRACAKGRLPCARIPGVGLRIDYYALLKMSEADMKARVKAGAKPPKPNPEPEPQPEAK